MRLKPTLITLATLLFLSITTVKAQTDTINLTPQHLAAAERLINITGMVDARFSSMRSEMIKSMSETIHVPEKNKAKFVSDMETFLNKYLVYATFKKGFVKIYAQTFTEDELKSLIDFYNSPLGKKIITAMPELTQKAMLMNSQALKDHYDEMQAIVATAIQQ